MPLLHWIGLGTMTSMVVTPHVDRVSRKGHFMTDPLPQRHKKVLAIVACVLLPALGVAQDKSGWEKLGSALGGGVDREGAYLDGMRQQAETEALIAETRKLQLEAEGKARNQRIQSQLVLHWQQVGLAPDQAEAIASTYEFSSVQTAIIADIRVRGADSAINPIRKALDEYNYVLANQLLIAFVIIAKEERTAEASSRAEMAPLAEVPPTQ